MAIHHEPPLRAKTASSIYSSYGNTYLPCCRSCSSNIHTTVLGTKKKINGLNWCVELPLGSVKDLVRSA